MNQVLAIGRYAALALCFGTMVMACATPADDDDASDDLPTVAEPIGKTRQAMPMCNDTGCFVEPVEPPGGAIVGGVCGQAANAQQKASLVWEYVNGGSVYPTDRYPCTAGGTLSSLSTLR